MPNASSHPNSSYTYLSYHRVLTFDRVAAKGLSCADLIGSTLNSVLRYNPRNRTIVCGRPFPCAKAAGPDKMLPMLTPAALGNAGALRPAVLLPPLPSVFPEPEKEALCFAGPRLASAAAERTAVRRAEGLAPRIVSTTLVPLSTRKVGILYSCNTNCQRSVSSVVSGEKDRADDIR